MWLAGWLTTTPAGVVAHSLCSTRNHYDGSKTSVYNW